MTHDVGNTGPGLGQAHICGKLNLLLFVKIVVSAVLPLPLKH